MKAYAGTTRAKLHPKYPDARSRCGNCLIVLKNINYTTDKTIRKRVPKLARINLFLALFL
jgi:hypothetical protein